MSKPGSDIPGEPVVAINADGRLELFTLGESVGPAGDTNAHAIWHRWQRASGGWSNWSSLGTPADDVPPGESKVFIDRNGCLELFTLAGDGAVWHRRQGIPGGSWSDWSSLGSTAGGFADGDLAVGETADGGLLLVATTRNDTDVWQRQKGADDRWSPWSVIATPATEITQTPTLAANADARLELFVRTVGTEKLYQLSQTSPSGPWSPGRQWPPP